MTEYKSPNLILFFILNLFLCLPGISQSDVKIYEEDWTIPGYKFPEADPNPMFFKGEAYQGASRVIYPYKLMDNIIREKEEKTLRAVIIENEFIKVCVTPEIGGKLYYATDKTNGYHFIYRNNTFKPANIGMTGAWVSGGIEWCLLHHHRASTCEPVDYTMEENADGSKTVWVGETEPRHRMRWLVGITVFPGKSYFQAEVKIHNPTSVTNSFLYWANVATHANMDYQVIFPPSTQFVTYHAKNSFAHWPVSDEIYNKLDYKGGIDLSWWKNHPEPISFFAYDLKENFSGGYDHGKETGTVHIGNRNIVKGAKLWEWGAGEKGRIWEKALSDTDGHYVELMTGAFSDNQPDYSWIKPYEVKTFRQYWYPVKNTKGFKIANLEAAVNLEVNEKKCFLAYYTTTEYKKARVVLEGNNHIIYEKEMLLSPKQTFSEEIKLPAGIKEIDLKTYLINLDKGDTIIFYQPKTTIYTKELPPVVQPPKHPSEIGTAEELYLIGKRIQQFHNATVDPIDYFNEALRRDPGDIRTNIALGTTAMKNMDYPLAKKYLRTALNRLTYNYTRPESCEALFILGVALKTTGELESATDTLYRATWDFAFSSAAYLELSKISCIQGKYAEALEQVNTSLTSNILNNSALILKANILRHLGRNKEAIELLNQLIKSDPLDFFALYERYLSSSKDKYYLEEFKVLMRDYDQNYLELFTKYMDIEEWAEVLNLLNIYLNEGRIININPLAYYYLAYTNLRLGEKEKAKETFRKASSLPVDYCFPHRFETVRILQTALEYYPGDAKPYYYLGNLLYDHQPEAAITNWEKAVELDPSFAIAHRNLGWGYYHTENNIPKAIIAYENALRSKHDDPVYYAELDALYELNNTPLDTRIELFIGRHNVTSKQGDSFHREILVLNLSGKYQEAIGFMAESKFQIREGQNQLRETNVDAHLLHGLELMSKGKTQDALNVFQAAHFMPGTNMEPQIGDDNRTPQINYYIGLAYETMANRKKSLEYYSKVKGRSFGKDDFITYYQGMALLRTGEKEKAEKVFNDLISRGEELLNYQESEVDFFAIYGKKLTDNQRKSLACLLKGLGFKGLNQVPESQELFKKAYEFYNSNLWAKAEL